MLVLGLLLGLGTAFGGEVYRGTVGTLPVFLTLAGQDSAVAYAHRGVPIPLDVQGQGGRLTLTEWLFSLGTADDRTVTGRYVLERRGPVLAGTWTDPAGRRRLPVRLTRVSAADVPPALPLTAGLRRLRATDAFGSLRLNHPWVRAAPAQGLPWIREPLSRVVYPRISGHALLNGAVQDLQLQDALEALSCAGSSLETSREPPSSSWEARSRVAYRSARLLTVVTEGMGFCAGAHPYHIGRAVTLDTRTGRTVDVRRAFPGLTDGRLRALYLRGYPRREDDCREQVQEQVPEVYPTPAGLVLWLPQLAHVVHACNEVVTVPYASLRNDLDPRSPYHADFVR